MASFNEEGLRKKLADLNMSQQSIQTMSLWLIHHKKHAHNIVNIWYKELVKAAQESKKLAFMYLANDVIQNSKRKGPEYNKEFIHRLPKAFKHLGTVELEEKALKNLNRLLQVWEERGIFDRQLIQEFRKRLGRNSKENQPERKAKHGAGKRVINNSKENQPEKKSRTGVETYAPKKSHKNDKESASKEPHSIDDEFPGAFEATIEDEPPIEVEKSPSPTATPSVSKPAQQATTVTPATIPKPAPEPEHLIQALQDLENAATADAEVRKQIAGLPPAVSDISGLGKLKDAMMGRDLQAQVDKALSILEVYNKRLAEEMEARKSVARLLHDYISHQKDVLTQTEETLEVHRAQYNKVQRVRHELRAHLQNLPDISKLPNLDGGLAPLPSAGDLFT